MIDGLAESETATFAAEYVAQIGETKYASFTDAITEAKSGETVKLLDNITLEVGYTGIRKDLIINLNGKVISGGALDVYNKLTITDSSTEKTGAINGVKHGVWVNPGAELTVESGTITSGSGYTHKIVRIILKNILLNKIFSSCQI